MQGILTKKNNKALEKELIINSNQKEIQLALIENKKLVELHNQSLKNNLIVGDIYLGRVTKLLPGLNAAFVNIGHSKKDAFLHYTDLGPKLKSLVNFTNGAIEGSLPTHLLKGFKIESDILKKGKINQVLTKGQNILVQVLKEPISTKGPRLCCEITIAGRYVVLTPFTNVIAVSKKVTSDDERERLRRLMESIRPKNFGFIVRTAAEGKRVAELHEDITELVNKWEKIYKELHESAAPIKCLSELNKTKSLIRDFWNESFARVIVNDKKVQEEVISEIKKVAPKRVDIVKFYSGSKPIFDQFGITKQIKSSFGKTATMASGAYLVIESTEAMHVVDVNSGHKMVGNDQEQNALRVNMESAAEIARQLRLRDIGGIIIIDFIDVRKNENKVKLFQSMKQFMAEDNAKHTILPLSKFGLMQITRERVRPAVTISTAEQCPVCNGTGKINPSILLLDDIKRDLEFIIKSQSPKNLTIHVHPFVNAYLRKGFWSLLMQWRKEYGRWIRVTTDSKYHMMKYCFFDDNDDEIRLN
ncbi:MAG: Cytoplasmic axial filament protein CafA and Ribonuclease G (EC [uncultured Aureispira sp.]|uniref:Cytoplasmic axial filament protein CafA and Ribonuclease G (EC) n=1 Tax=uncultured Aureispira sp. TaxID=1331704 RepID=A0A6S6S8I7_9BACT|nr:MAG: Cytoplasmic axial filament protein CafA and Ribonuclease G (EC [uncultured Aureispira sp.]